MTGSETSTAVQPKISAITTSQVGALTGPTAPVNQQPFDICGTDLGTMTEQNGRVYFAFGDTFGYDGTTCANKGGVGGPNWRSNTFASAVVTDPSGGIPLSDWLVGSDGKAIAVIQGEHDAADAGPGTEQTKIPTALVSVDDTIYLHFMSVRGFAAAGGVWDCNYTTFVYSADDGQTWTTSATQFSSGTSNFVELALTNAETPDNPDGSYVYAFGTPSGRFGGAQLGRAPGSSLTDPTTWEYLTAVPAAGASPVWSSDVTKAATLIPAPVGEASILWNPAISRWMYTYLNQNTSTLELREADHLWGPWSDPHTLATATAYPALYGAFMTPSLLSADGRTLYFIMSQFGPYNTFVMKAQLTFAGTTTTS